MGAGASTDFKSVEEAQAAGVSQEDIDSYLAKQKGKANLSFAMGAAPTKPVKQTVSSDSNDGGNDASVVEPLTKEQAQELAGDKVFAFDLICSVSRQ